LNSRTYQTAPITCPNCNTPFSTPVLTIVDVGQNPEAKGLLLSGRINIAVCPQCGNAGMLTTPLVYHDPEKELLFTFAPSELGLGDADQQRLIGDLTNRVMSSLPAEKRKGYLLRPRSFLRLEAMIEAILEADGITPEMMKAQRERAELLERLVRASNEDARQVIAREYENQIDYEFFQLLSLNVELSQSEGQEEVARELLVLRQQLLQWTTSGREISTREKAIEDLGEEVSRERLLEKLVAAALAGEEIKVETMVAYARPVIDYAFYQQLSARIETASQNGDTSTAGTLTKLREQVLDMTAQIDAQFQQVTEESAKLLQEVVDSDDLEGALRMNLEKIDELFLSILATNLRAAEQAGRSQEAERLKEIGEKLVTLVEESQPPEIRLINQLLTAEYPEGTLALLNESRDQITSSLVELMRLVAEDLRQNGRLESAERLAQVREQTQTLLVQN
jgi:hypothetical protein